MQLLPGSADIVKATLEATDRVSYVYAQLFRERSAVEPNCGWQTLAEIFNFHFRSSDAASPFGPIAVMEGKRSMIPDDLTREQLDALEAVLPEVQDPEFRARIGDVLWITRKNPAAARAAVEGYFAAGSALEDPEHWVQSMERYERAVRLARQIEPKGELPRRVLQHLESRVLHYKGKDPLYFSLKAMELLEEFRFGDFGVLAGIAEGVADAARCSGDFDRARSYYAIRASLLRRAGRPDEAEAALCARAESFVQDAEAQEAAGTHMTAHHFWEEAVQAFQDRPSLRARIPELRRRLAEAGKRTVGEMKVARSGEFDISAQVNAVRGCFRGRSWDDALFQLALMIPLINAAELRQQTIETFQTSPLRTLIKADVFDAAGRKIAVRPPLQSGDPEKEEAAIQGFMDEAARIHRHLYVHATLAPAIRVIKDEHDVNDDAVKALIADSEFIPEGRLSLFVKGIAAGFRFDFSTALHFLVPQSENALRDLLQKQADIVPRNIDQDGVEQVWSVEKVLAHDKMEGIIGADFIYELRTLLAGRLGPNIRNLIAHGLASENSLNGEMGFYLWWVLLRLSALPTSGMAAFLERRETAESGGSTSPDASPPTCGED